MNAAPNPLDHAARCAPLLASARQAPAACDPERVPTGPCPAWQRLSGTRARAAIGSGNHRWRELVLLAALLVGWLVSAGSTQAAPVAFRRLPVPEDVPAELCTALAQDRAGFLWIGTQSGLLRFDGQQFRHHPPEPGTSYIRTLLAASDGRLWAGTFAGGLVEHDPLTDTFVQHRDGLSHARVEGLAEDRDGAIWIATQEGLDRLQPGSGQLDHFRHAPGNPHSLADDQVRGLIVDRSGALWVGSRGGLQRFHQGRFEPLIPALAGRFVSRLLEDDRGRIWVGTIEHGASVLDPATGTVRHLEQLGHKWIYALAQVGRGEVWLATFGGGIDVVDAETLVVTDHLRADSALPDSLPGDRIGALLRDRSGLVWVGTWGQGLARHDPATRAFRTLRHSPTKPLGLSHPAAVRAMQMGDGNLWVGTNGNGVDVFDAHDRRLRTLLPGTAITSLGEGPDGARWVATLGGELYRFTGSASRRFTTNDGLPGGAIRTIAFGPDGEAWVGAALGLARLDARGVATFRHRRDDPTTLSGNAVESIAFDREQRMWVGTDAGLNLFDRRSGRATRITAGLPNNWVPDLLVDSRGWLWVGTNGGACVLERLEGQRAVCPPVAKRLGRAPEPAEALIEDDQGQVWIGPRLRVDPTRWTATAFRAGDGRAFRSFYIASRARTRDGSLLFGSPEGLLVVQPAAIEPWTFAPPVVATSLRVGGQERSVPPLLQLEPGERGFRLDFAALDFTAPEQLSYRYLLEGYDRDWTATDASRRSLAYTGLPPGRFALRVQATNRAGVWSQQELRLGVSVPPAFYETAWFRALAAIAALGLAVALHRARVWHLERRQQELEATVRARTDDLRGANAELSAANQKLRQVEEKIAEMEAASVLALVDVAAWAERTASEVARAIGAARIEILPASDEHPQPPDAAAGTSVIPVLGMTGTPYGALRVERPQQQAGGSEQRLLAGFARQLGLALELKRLREELAAAEERRAHQREELLAAGVGVLQVCPRCKACFDETAARCPVDGSLLKEDARLLPCRILSRYLLTQVLGEGGMGIVFAARDLRLAREVAIKIVRAEHMNSVQVRQRLEQEARALAQVSHPGVIAIFDSGSLADGSVFLVTERLTGVSLRELLSRVGRGTPQQVAALLRQGAAALAAAHARGLVHRDIKPDNIFLVENATGPQVKLLDFGIAKELTLDQHLTQTGMIVGTPPYMSPEQLKGREVDARSDLYSFAAVAFEALAGQRWLSGDDLVEIFAKMVKADVGRLDRLVPGLPSSVQSGFAAALAYERDQRPRDIEAWAEALAAEIERVPGTAAGWAAPDAWPTAETPRGGPTPT